MVTFGTWIFLFGSATCGGISLDRRYRTQLLLTQDASNTKRDKVAIAGLVVAIISLVVVVVGVVVAHLDAIHPQKLASHFSSSTPTGARTRPAASLHRPT